MSDETDQEHVVRNVDELKALIGQEITTGQWVELTQDLVDGFVAATSMPPIQATSVDRMVVPGYFLLSAGGIIGRNAQRVRIDLGGRLTVNYGLNQVRFPMTVHVGQRVRARTTLLKVDEIDHRAVQLTRLNTIDIDGETEPACVAESLMRVYF